MSTEDDCRKGMQDALSSASAAVEVIWNGTEGRMQKLLTARMAATILTHLVNGQASTFPKEIRENWEGLALMADMAAEAVVEHSAEANETKNN